MTGDTTAEYVGSWRTAIRIARRSAWRNKGRSALILSLLFLPAWAATILVVSWANLSGTSAQETDFSMGRADVIVDDVDGVPAILPTGSRALSLTTGRTVVGLPGGLLAAREYEAVDVIDPLTRGKYVIRAGEAPQGATEVAVTQALADELGVGLGGQVDAGMPQRRLTVVGIVDLSRSLGLAALVASADAPLSTGGSRKLMVDLPDDNESWIPPPPSDTGFFPSGYMSRATYRPSVEQQALDAAAVTLVTAFAGAQVVLLAGAAFTVGARRQRRELAMVVAVGATPRQVRRIVLAGGLLLGAGAAVAGAAVGLLVVLLARPTIERVADHPFIDFAVAWWQVAAVAVLTIVTGLLAAYLPARAAGGRLVRAELGGQRSSRNGLAGTAVGLTLVTGGTALLLVSATPDGRIELIVAGVLAQLLGIILCGPILIVGLARLARALPLSGRLALRHSARHRLRTAAAMAAVVAAVAGSVALTLVGGAQAETPPPYRKARPGQILLPAEAADLLGPDGVPALAAALPTRSTEQLRLARDTRHGQLAHTSFPSPDPGEDQPNGAGFDQHQIAVGGAETVRLVTGREATRAELDVLRKGGVVVFNDVLMLSDNRVRLLAGGDGEDLPAVVASTGEYFANLPGVLVSEATARRLGYTVTPGSLVLETERPAHPDELARATTVLLRAQLAVEPVPGSPITVELADVADTATETNPMYYVLSVISVLITLTASVVAVGLAISELRGDLSTMSAVGATPRMSRRIAAAQAVVIVGFGAPLGLLAGIGPAAGYVAYSIRYDWHTPWLALCAVVMLPPVLAVLLAGVLHRNRLPLVRRTL